MTEPTGNGRRILRVAVAQVGGIQRDVPKAAVVERLVSLLEEAHHAGAEFVVFPELTLTTFFPRYWITDESELDSYYETSMPNPSVQPLFDAAVAFGMGFYLGYGELVEEPDGTKRRFNSSVLVGSDGQVIGKYRKIHLPGHVDHRQQLPFQQLEKRYFEPGDLGFGVWWLGEHLLGMALCNDRRWPETFRVMGLQGVELVALGFNTHDVNQYHHEPKHLKMLHHFVVMQASAYQNGTWIAAAAKSGDEDGHEMIGGSCIIAPTGEIVAQTSTTGDEVIVFACDLALGDNIKRFRFNFEEHRRIEHYGLICSQTGVVKPVRPVTS